MVGKKRAASRLTEAVRYSHGENPRGRNFYGLGGFAGKTKKALKEKEGKRSFPTRLAGGHPTVGAGEKARKYRKVPSDGKHHPRLLWGGKSVLNLHCTRGPGGREAIFEERDQECACMGARPVKTGRKSIKRDWCES